MSDKLHEYTDSDKIKTRCNLNGTSALNILNKRQLKRTHSDSS